MNHRLPHRFTGDLIVEVEAETQREALIKAIRSGANLSYADLRSANLSYADLRYAEVNFRSHDLLAEILRREAGEDVEKRKIAGLVLVSRDWCWSQVLRSDDPLKPWALEVLSGYVVDGDNAPPILRDLAAPRLAMAKEAAS